MIMNMGSLMPSMPTTPSKQRTSDICMTKNSYDVPNTTKIMVLLTTFTSSQRLKPESNQQLLCIFMTSPDDQIPQRLQTGH
jgi:hypothetical protein